jgi:hypothetical protein
MEKIMTLKTNGDYIFNYKVRDLRNFIKIGRATGDVGMIVVKRTKSGMVTYKGFGTIEHPSKDIMSIRLQFDEKFDTPQRPPIVPTMSYRYHVINLR